MKRLSPCHAKHVELGASFLDYCGWQIPRVYTTPDDEIQRVREGAGITEYAFMSHLAVQGRDAQLLLQRITCRDVSSHRPGRAAYTLSLDDAGAIREDAVVYRLADDFFIINSRPRINITYPRPECLLEARMPKDWVSAEAKGLSVCLYELGVTLLSLQGPLAPNILGRVARVNDLRYLDVVQMDVGEIPAIVARAGYSGEPGYEFLVWPEYAVALWELLEDAANGQPDVGPYGIEVAWIIGLEKGFLGGSDFYPGSTPLEVGLGGVVSFDNPDFIGRDALLQRRSKGLDTRLVGFAVDAPQLPFSPGDAIRSEGAIVGKVTASAYSPTLRKCLGRGWVFKDLAFEGQELEITNSQDVARISVAASYRWYDPDGSRLRA